MLLIYSGINDGINIDDLRKFSNNEKYSLTSVLEDDFIDSINKNDNKFRLTKKWLSDSIVDNRIIHINDIDVIKFFADIEENCLYKIQLFRKFY